jgi:hypothetical protein
MVEELLAAVRNKLVKKVPVRDVICLDFFKVTGRA